MPTYFLPVLVQHFLEASLAPVSEDSHKMASLVVCPYTLEVQEKQKRSSYYIYVVELKKEISLDYQRKLMASILGNRS